MTYVPGQRWISNSESQLGLGIITELNGRQVSISFPAAEEDRIYAVDNAPLCRIIFKIGEEIQTNDLKKIKVTHIDEHQGLILYTGLDEGGESLTITEISLNCFIKLSTPQQRLFSGLIDKLSSFKLRIETLNHTSRLQQSTVRGLIGSRTNHLPHQIYIANEVAQRYAPRVLLADEVGLGKTIEAGMILHYQLHTGRANRVLIVVPDNLIHQWLVEMIRRFNLHFSIFDQTRFIPDHDDENVYFDNSGNLFETEQLILCSIDFLLSNEDARQQAIDASWDLLIVDEAHHLHWSEEATSPEYDCIDSLSEKSKGLLLLTATPEQVGITSHFARLRLLDPSRFHDFSKFKNEEDQYQEVNKLVQKLIMHKDLNPNAEINLELKNQLKDYLGDVISTNIDDTIQNLLDRHGTSRVLFRNTRAAISGFPNRILHSYPLERPNIYSNLSDKDGIANLYPETTVSVEEWIIKDPRVQWLVAKIIELRPEKVLVICASASTAIDVEIYLKIKSSIRSTAFHEGLSLIERDRAAAYFSEEESGAQVLICSEIGSEGRNFQFSHHLILFDLPLNPDLLEQRIGRLDRIGQRNTIEIHAPYLLNTAQEKLFRWYNEGINLFEKSCSIGFSIYQFFENRLLPLLYTNTNSNSLLEQLISDTNIRTAQLNTAMNDGRDKLLEMNSCKLPIAEQLISNIEAEENSLELESYMAKVFQEYGIDHEYHSNSAEILRPTEHMKTGHFPGLYDDDLTVTYSRNKALVREDMVFLSWEHPMVNESMEMILDSAIGNATVSTISIKSIKPGTLFLECFYTINCASPKHLQLDRYLPFTPMRVLMDLSGKNLSKVLSYEQLNSLCEQVKRLIAYPIVVQIRDDIESIIAKSNAVAEQQMAEVVESATAKMHESLSTEIMRLVALQKVNPSIRDEEIAYFKKQIEDNNHFIRSAVLNLQAIRVVINK